MDTVLELLKLDLGVTHKLRDLYFMHLIEGCADELERKNIKLDKNAPDDQMLLSDYAAWQYRHRQEDVPLARNLQLRIANRAIRGRSGND